MILRREQTPQCRKDKDKKIYKVKKKYKLNQLLYQIDLVGVSAIVIYSTEKWDRKCNDLNPGWRCYYYIHNITSYMSVVADKLQVGIIEYGLSTMDCVAAVNILLYIITNNDNITLIYS